MKIKKFLMTLAIPVIAMTFASCSDDDDTPDVNNVPTKFTESFNKLYPEVKTAKWETKGQYRVAEFKQNNNMIETEVWFDSNADRVMVHNDYGENLFLIPTVINDAIVDSQYGTMPWSVDDIDEYVMTGSSFFVIEAEAAGQPDTYVFINDAGQVVKEVTGNIPDITPSYQL